LCIGTAIWRNGRSCRLWYILRLLLISFINHIKHNLSKDIQGDWNQRYLCTRSLDRCLGNLPVLPFLVYFCILDWVHHLGLLFRCWFVDCSSCYHRETLGKIGENTCKKLLVSLLLLGAPNPHPILLRDSWEAVHAWKLRSKWDCAWVRCWTCWSA
jgi:hypothetical protein